MQYEVLRWDEGDDEFSLAELCNAFDALQIRVKADVADRDRSHQPDGSALDFDTS